MGYIYDHLNDYVKEFNIVLSDTQLQQFDKYFDLLIEWNEKINLTSITDPKEVCIKHYADSVSIGKYYPISNQNIIDIGTGAGFPGIPLKILFPDIKITLLDSLNKRINFLNLVVEELNLSGVTCIHGRAEDYAHDKTYREKYDICVSRAVANMSTLSEYCLPFVKTGGKFISYKADYSNEERDSSVNAISILGGKVSSVESFSLSDYDYKRTFVIIDKCKNCSGKYPRKAGTPSKNPL